MNKVLVFLYANYDKTDKKGLKMKTENPSYCVYIVAQSVKYMKMFEIFHTKIVRKSTLLSCLEIGS